ncbi:YxeA family protein [Pseudalkalibacillus decolorationis]|uniref:YxeA family protein n=1 Tax=Pseudalkalibacillus decolorationis TaxID=163879 RepID=UPI0021483907|nr:YxeA family protein [Pseudalkalibacillus decolorationis]
MKKIIGTIVFLFIIMGVIILTLPEEISDRINPLVQKEGVYVQINEKGEPQNPGGYYYTLEGYTENGETQQITFYTGRASEGCLFAGCSKRRLCGNMGRSPASRNTNKGKRKTYSLTVKHPLYWVLYFVSTLAIDEV